LDNIELLTLSACNTAMTSGANSSGVEVEGFGAMAQKQGAKTILATLWAVADDSTSELMGGFYKTLEVSPQMGKAEALRKAQIALLKGKSADAKNSTGKRSGVFKTGDEKESTQPKFTTDKNAPFAHPYYWSPFVLIGNWR
jgi:CHAT domain-containing protein